MNKWDFYEFFDTVITSFILFIIIDCSIHKYVWVQIIWFNHGVYSFCVNFLIVLEGFENYSNLFCQNKDVVKDTLRLFESSRRMSNEEIILFRKNIMIVRSENFTILLQQTYLKALRQIFTIVYGTLK